jgi:hypothetical protein
MRIGFLLNPADQAVARPVVQPAVQPATLTRRVGRPRNTAPPPGGPIPAGPFIVSPSYVARMTTTQAGVTFRSEFGAHASVHAVAATITAARSSMVHREATQNIWSVRLPGHGLVLVTLDATNQIEDMRRPNPQEGEAGVTAMVETLRRNAVTRNRYRVIRSGNAQRRRIRDPQLVPAGQHPGSQQPFALSPALSNRLATHGRSRGNLRDDFGFGANVQLAQQVIAAANATAMLPGANRGGGRDVVRSLGYNDGIWAFDVPNPLPGAVQNPLNQPFTVVLSFNDARTQVEDIRRVTRPDQEDDTARLIRRLVLERANQHTTAATRRSAG